MIFFFGFAGSGKSLQGQKVVEKYGWRWLSAGQLLRDCNDPEITRLQNAGVLVDNKFVSKMMHDAMRAQAETGVNAIVDGYPRDIAQLDNIIEYGDLELIDGAIIFDVPKDELMRRMIARGRADDNEAAIEKRWAIFENYGKRIVDRLKEHGIKVKTVDGLGEIEEISKRVDAVLEEWNLVEQNN